MVVSTFTSAFFLTTYPPPTESSMMLGGGSENLDTHGINSSKLASTGGLKVKVNAQAPREINDTTVSYTRPTEIVKNEEEVSSPPPRTFINQLLDSSVLLTEKQWTLLVDLFGVGRLVQDGLVFRQNFSIRSYEIGADQTASIETLGYVQEASLNHVRSMGLLGDGFGSTPEMTRRNLIWVVAKMQVLVDRYPSWGDVVQVDTWISASGKNRIRQDWLLRDSNTGETLTRATSVWVIMNKKTRKVSKLPEEVRGELKPYLMDCAPILDEDSRKLPNLDDDTADFVQTGLTPRWNDLDVNQHVNNVKYIGWIVENAPPSILKSHELFSMTLEYRKECGMDNVLKSLTAVFGDVIVSGSVETGGVECEHMLLLENGGEILRGRTKWRPKHANFVTVGQIPVENA
ncbi:Acyl-ACP thioesterase [Macleaya cordata]|uniref:Acyl-[acyl-carrier-protein] hydrolase n=1 Tax=Macleaya cordata TaxID=56857 RepID=A0A200PN94_MACCD|nr:Acyl-ACP thioesterase [Macleaya cordata]